MNRYSGVIGVRGEPVETSPGIFDDGLFEVHVTGKVYRKHSRWSQGEASQDEIQINHVIKFIPTDSILSNLDGVAYATYQGTKWVVRSLEYNRPSLEISLGGVYNA